MTAGRYVGHAGQHADCAPCAEVLGAVGKLKAEMETPAFAAALEGGTMEATTERRTCGVCGGDGWTAGSAELRRDGRTGDTTCIGCGGSGYELVRVLPTALCSGCGLERRVIDGLICRHGTLGHVCSGSGTVPQEGSR